ncbi:hypothetical protein AVEN_245216-1 [Araneus ventricosus]|uniref:Uncharacterized protein n=1 Tax=Araneus ventricosus TaxID=182803 RepID=A0A4Y2V312_ARAVE|nr:hypothetical protein AVEN_155601-1 [Araneus ventricosus]GBO18921.1 hypothetical protein AVEN_245216-1 [Araneus ventricosus]
MNHGDSFQPFLFEVWRWIPHMPRHFVNTLRGLDLEMKATDWSIHPPEHLEPNQISLEDGEANIARKEIINIFTDGSKSDGFSRRLKILTYNSKIL